jgi:endoglucanase
MFQLALVPEVLAAMDEWITFVTDAGGYVILDPHNYGRYYGSVVGNGTNVTTWDFANFWSR